MILYDYQCKGCEYVFEKFVPENTTVYCPKCGFYTKRILGVPGGTNANQDAKWIRSVREVVDKDGGPHCQEFLKRPTRENYENWKKVEGIRDFEQGEKPGKPPPVDMEKIEREVWEKHQKRHRIEV